MTTPPRRILEIIASTDPASGGPVEGLLRQAEVTNRVGVVRELATLDAPDAPYLKNFPLKVHALGRATPSAFRPLAHYGHSPKLIPWLKANIGHYDAIIVNGLWNYATFAASRTLPRGGVPYFVFTHGMMDPWFRRTYPKKHLAKLGFWAACEGPLLHGAQAVFFTTEEERNLARGQFFGWPYQEAVVGYGTSQPPEATPAQLEAFAGAVPALRGRSYLLYLSRIHPKKGCDLLIEAFAKHAAACPELDLVVAGPDQEDWVKTLQARAKALGVEDRIHWPGMLRGDAKWGAFRGAQAFILPSHQENFGIVVAESLACGTPVLITDKVNIWREVKDGNGGLVETDTLQGVEALIGAWLALPEDARRRTSENATQVFKTCFDVETIAPALIATMGGLS